MAAAAIGAVATVGSSYLGSRSSRKAGKAEAKSQELANAIEQRKAEISNQRMRRQAAMETVSGIAQNIAGSSSLASSTSMAAGATSALQSSLSSAIGDSNTALAANQARANTLQQGYNTSLRYRNQASNWGAVSNLSGQATALVWPS